MGLIREVQNVGASLNKQERARRQRERLKILQENYKREIKEILFAEFTAIYNNYNIDDGEKIIILKKDDIIKKSHKEIYSRHYLQNSDDVQLVFLPSPSWDKNWRFEQKKEKVFLYHDFDIITDLNDNYYKIAQQAKKDFEKVQKIKFDYLLTELKKRIIQSMNLNESTYFLSLSLQQNKNIIAIVDDITTDEKERAFLFDNYDKTLRQILKLYHGDIEREKIKIKAQKSRKHHGVLSQFITGYILTDIKKSLPKASNKKRGI